MRSKLFLAGVTFVIGCGGGGGKKAMIVDAMVDSPTIDATAACSVNCELSAQICGPGFNTPAFPALRFGSTANKCRIETTQACTTDAECTMANDSCSTRVEGNWFVTFMDAPLAGRKAFNIGLIMDDKVNPDVLFIRLMKPEVGNFPVGTATNFDPNPATEAPVAWSYWFGDATISGNMITDATQEYYANMGSITLTAVGEADGANISGSTAPITWREIDDMGVDVAGGCTATLGMAGGASGFTFDLVQKAAAFQPQHNGGEGYPRQVSPELAESLGRYVDAKMAKLKLQQH